MSLTNVMRFVIYGAVGFGMGGAAASLMLLYIEGWGLLIGSLFGGTVGGGSLGMALKDFRQVIVLALLGAVGLTLGSFSNYLPVVIAAIVGAGVGASLDAAFTDGRTIVALAVAGAVGFSVGTLPTYVLLFSIPIIKQLGDEGTAIAGNIGGASLGAAIGHLENSKLVQERSPRVR
ncbi:MAG TPA: hypothetical protein VF068_12080 [Rubrobacter sp.]